MTREEAIKCLKSLLEVRRKYGAMQTMKDEAQCLDMAIKALEQEPVLDKIRTELIQSIQNGTIQIEKGNEELFRILDKYRAERKGK